MGEKMTNAQAAEILRQHNAWRRGNDDEMPDAPVNPTRLGRAIDHAVAHLTQPAQAVDVVERIRAKLSAIRAKTGNLLFDAGTYDACVRIEALLAAPPAQPAERVPEGWRDALRSLLDHIDAQTCRHESTHRGGAIWTICDDCGDKWADDKGGFKPYEDAPAVAVARALLAAPAAPAEEGDGKEGDEVDCERCDGNGGWGRLYSGPSHLPSTACPDCNGTGKKPTGAAR